MKTLIVSSDLNDSCCNHFKSALIDVIPDAEVEVVNTLEQDLGDVISVVAFQLNASVWQQSKMIIFSSHFLL